MLEKIRLNYPNITFKLYNKIYGYLESKGSSLIKYDINSLIESLPFTLKNSILFTMYNKTITNFKFFKNNNNSVFIAEVLNNFIPNVTKKNEFLIYEGEMLEKIRLSYPNITFKLYNKIYGYLESKSSSLMKYDINSLIESLPFTLKNNILFTMYNKTITNFKFFKNNNNSVFIAEVLNNFIPNVSKKNEFLIYEGEMLEEIIFIKDGIISLNAAINTENPMKSINKYFFESFSPFTTEEEKKLINENINYKSGLTVIGDLNLDRIKNKINNAFRSGKNLGGKSQFELPTNVDKNDNFNFDVKGGAIINDEGDYQYLKVLDIRKNEHFGCVFMTLNKPCPLSIQVKSKLVELFLLKKDTAVNLSKSYPNIWRKIYAREFHNLRTIKKQTFAILKKYIEINDLLAYNNCSDSKLTNRNSISSFDINLNLVEKSAFGEKSKMKSKKKVINKKYSKSNSLNFVFDKQMNKINLDFDFIFDLFEFDWLKIFFGYKIFILSSKVLFLLIFLFGVFDFFLELIKSKFILFICLSYTKFNELLLLYFLLTTLYFCFIFDFSPNTDFSAKFKFISKEEIDPLFVSFESEKLLYTNKSFISIYFFNIAKVCFLIFLKL